MTAHKVEKQTIIRRAEESRVSDLLRYTAQSQKLCNAAKSEVMISNARKANFISQVEAENLAREHIEKQNESVQRSVLKQLQSRRLAEKISNEKRERKRMELEIQRICETSEELKELESSLKIAYVNKERAVQQQERILINNLEQARNHEIDKQMEFDRQQEIERDYERDKKRREKLSKQKIVLQRQIKDNKVRAIILFVFFVLIGPGTFYLLTRRFFDFNIQKEFAQKIRIEALKDKNIVDAIVTRINEEDKLELKERKRKKEETRMLIQQFYEEREKHKRLLAQQEKEQEAEIEAYNKVMEQRKEQEEFLKKTVDDERRARWEKVTEETKALNQSKEILDTLRDMLWQEELEEKRINEEKQLAIARARRKKEMMRDNQSQIKNKREMIAEMEREERRMVDVMLAKFEADEIEEQKKAQIRKMEKNHFVQEAQIQRKERARMFELEKEKQLRERSAGAEKEEYRQRVIAEARRKLLSQHATELKGFLPKVRW